MRSFFAFPGDRLRCYLIAAVVSLSLAFEIGCGGASSLTSSAAAQQSPQSATAVAAAASTHPILLFNGAGTSPSDVAAVEAVLNSMGLKFVTANSGQLNTMTQAQMNSYKLFLVPGGNSITIGENLTAGTTARMHNAIVSGGLHYLGICAGGFFGGYSIYNGLNLTGGVWFNLYPDHYKGINKEALEIAASNSTRLDQYWQDGPEFTGWGNIIGKYPDGKPAIVEGKAGNGWVILSGVHPEAPQSWRYGMTFTTPVATDNAYAKTLISAALNYTPLPHY
jgi:glutamine amidotransferase-like uncharacterized protein